MLEINKTIRMIGTCTIDGVRAEAYSADIDADKPDNTTIIQRHINISLCEGNKEECRKDSAEFEDAVYQMIDKISEEIADKEDL